jgi:hypothetical protein
MPSATNGAMGAPVVGSVPAGSTGLVSATGSGGSTSRVGLVVGGLVVGAGGATMTAGSVDVVGAAVDAVVGATGASVVVGAAERGAVVWEVGGLTAIDVVDGSAVGKVVADASVVDGGSAVVLVDVVVGAAVVEVVGSAVVVGAADVAGDSVVVELATVVEVVGAAVVDVDVDVGVGSGHVVVGGEGRRCGVAAMTGAAEADVTHNDPTTTSNAPGSTTVRRSRHRDLPFVVQRFGTPDTS